MRLVLLIALLVVGVGAGVWVERQPLLRGLAGLWIVSDRVTRADAVVVLGGGLNWRPFVAADLYQRGLVSRVLVSRVRDDERAVEIGVLPTHAELNRKVLLKLGVPSTSIEMFGEESNNTESEARALKAWAEHNTASVLIIPIEPFSTRRARWIFQREFYGTGVRIEISSLGTEYYVVSANLTHELLIVFQREILKYYLLSPEILSPRAGDGRSCATPRAAVRSLGARGGSESATLSQNRGPAKLTHFIE